MIAGWLEFFHEVNSLPNLYIPALVNHVISHSVSNEYGGAEGVRDQGRYLDAKGTQDVRPGRISQAIKPSVQKASWARARAVLKTCESEAREKARDFRKIEGGVPEDWNDEEAWEDYVKA
eukprot:8273167-Heterocapsa_arctica.AAC.1